MVSLLGYKFVDQVALRTHDFHAVVACALRQTSAVGVIFDGLLDLLRGQRMGAKGVDRRFERTGRHQLGVVSVAAKVQDLHRNFAARIVHSLGDYFVLVGLGLRGHSGATGHGAGAVVGGNAARHDQAHSALGALGIKRRHTVEAVLGLL